MRRYRENNPEKSKAYTNKWRAENKDLVYLYNTKKDAKRRLAINATINKITVSEWKKIKLLYKNKCAYCLKEFKKLTMDHVVPLVKGGSHDKDNIVPACKSCNSSKQARDQFEFVAKKFGRLL
jgi:5-methylcytosine-specific restriction endonuclease McrA